jgi:hypothetical protein
MTKTVINKINFQSSRLYPKSRFITGMGSVFNVAGNYFDYNYSKSGIEADNKAIQKDWDVVGKSFRQTIENF